MEDIYGKNLNNFWKYFDIIARKYWRTSLWENVGNVEKLSRNVREIFERYGKCFKEIFRKIQENYDIHLKRY